jgi:hypothetical protein
MALVIVGWLTTACVLLYQGIYTLRTGYITLFFAKPEHSRPASGPVSRFAYAFVYLFPGVAAIVILVIALTRAGLSRPADWSIENFGTLFWPVCAIAIGVPSLLRPEQILRRTLRDNPELADNSFVVLITRFIGAGFLFVGFSILATLKS